MIMTSLLSSPWWKKVCEPGVEFGDREAWWQHCTVSYPSVVEHEVQEHDKEPSINTQVQTSIEPDIAE